MQIKERRKGKETNETRIDINKWKGGAVKVRKATEGKILYDPHISMMDSTVVPKR